MLSVGHRRPYRFGLERKTPVQFSGISIERRAKDCCLFRVDFQLVNGFCSQYSFIPLIAFFSHNGCVKCFSPHLRGLGSRIDLARLLVSNYPTTYKGYLFVLYGDPIPESKMKSRRAFHIGDVSAKFKRHGFDFRNLNAEEHFSFEGHLNVTFEDW